MHTTPRTYTTSQLSTRDQYILLHNLFYYVVNGIMEDIYICVTTQHPCPIRYGGLHWYKDLATLFIYDIIVSRQEQVTLELQDMAKDVSLRHQEVYIIC